MTLKSTGRTLKLAAKMRNDDEMLAVVKGVDLCVKDFGKHSKCYKEYTMVVHQASRSKLKTKKFTDFPLIKY